eukprot:3086924-Amphidinium_carterae.1
MEPTPIEESAKPPLFVSTHMQLLKCIPEVQGQRQDLLIGSRSALQVKGGFEQGCVHTGPAQ